MPKQIENKKVHEINNERIIGGNHGKLNIMNTAGCVAGLHQLKSKGFYAGPGHPD